MGASSRHVVEGATSVGIGLLSKPLAALESIVHRTALILKSVGAVLLLSTPPRHDLSSLATCATWPEVGRMPAEDGSEHRARLCPRKLLELASKYFGADVADDNLR
jgi:hypothetical protein